MLRQDSGQKEPPSSQSAFPLYMIGRDGQGRWVVQDQSGLHGGLFINRAEALKFALFENGHRPQAVVMVPGILELNMAPAPALNNNAPLRHAAA
jgi:hypothetical protein